MLLLFLFTMRHVSAQKSLSLRHTQRLFTLELPAKGRVASNTRLPQSPQVRRRAAYGKFLDCTSQGSCCLSAAASSASFRRCLYLGPLQAPGPFAEHLSLLCREERTEAWARHSLLSLHSARGTPCERSDGLLMQWQGVSVQCTGNPAVTCCLEVGMVLFAQQVHRANHFRDRQRPAPSASSGVGRKQALRAHVQAASRPRGPKGPSRGPQKTLVVIFLPLSCLPGLSYRGPGRREPEWIHK